MILFDFALKKENNFFLTGLERLFDAELISYIDQQMGILIAC